jgi:apolipoprotein N-acyltransferase
MALAGRLLATLSSAALYGLSFPPARLRLLAWVALVPLLLALRGGGLAAALLLAWLWTIAAAYAVGDWFPRAVATYYDQPFPIGVAFFAGVTSLMAAPYYVAFAACYRALARAPGAALPLLAAAAWVGAELGRTKILTGNPWALAGYSQAGVAPVVQVADLAGIYGVSFAVVAVNAALAEVARAAGTAVSARWRPSAAGAVQAAHVLRRPLAGSALAAPIRHVLRRALAGAALVALALGLVLAYGRHRLAGSDPPAAASLAVRVAVVQANLDLGSQWQEGFYGRNLDAYLRLTRDRLRASAPALVLWPENALTFFLDDEPAYRAAIAHLFAPAGAQLLVGGPRHAGAEAPVFYNSAFLLSPEGAILGRYDKRHLLPFAEYFPLRRLDLLRRRFARVRELTPGEPAPPLPTVAGPAGVLICNEAMFPEIAAARAREGAAFLVNLSNDTWIPEAKFSEQQLDIASVRAVEQRRYLVRASTSGPSAIVDPAGRVTGRTASLAAGTLAGTVRPASGLTPYARLGDAFAIGCALAALAAALARVRRG